MLVFTAFYEFLHGSIAVCFYGVGACRALFLEVSNVGTRMVAIAVKRWNLRNWACIAASATVCAASTFLLKTVICDTKPLLDIESLTASAILAMRLRVF